MCKYAFPALVGLTQLGGSSVLLGQITLTAAVYCLRRTMKADEGMNNHGAAAAH